MTTLPWQHFRDEVSRHSDIALICQLANSIQISITGYIIGKLGRTPFELRRIIGESAVHRNTLRDVLATFGYLCQFEDKSNARNWFISVHPTYDESPMDLFRNFQSAALLEDLRNGDCIVALNSL